MVVRLVASPEQIKTEVAETPREVLRAIWRVAGQALKTGVSIDLMALPPGLGGVEKVRGVLRELETAGFVATF